MRLFHRKTGPRARRRDGTYPLRFAGSNDARARRDNTYALRLRREGLNRPLSPWHFRGWGADFIVSRTGACTLVPEIFFFFFFFPDVWNRWDACLSRGGGIFHLFTRVRGLLFYLKLLLLKFVLHSRFNLFYNIKGRFIGDILSII